MGTMAATGFTPILSGDAKATRNKQKTRAARVVSLYERPPPYDAALEELEAFFADNLSQPATGMPIRALLQAFADDRGIPL